MEEVGAKLRCMEVGGTYELCFNAKMHMKYAELIAQIGTKNIAIVDFDGNLKTLHHITRRLY